MAEVTAVQLNAEEAQETSTEVQSGGALSGLRQTWLEHRLSFIILIVWIFLALAGVIEVIAVPKTAVGNFINWGNIPRVPRGLIGIITSPFIHVNFGHFALNAIGIVILGSLMVMRGNKQFVGFSLSIMFGGGFLLWIVGRNLTQIGGIYFYISHVGASGMLFGYFATLLTIPIFERPFQLKSFASALVGGILYGGLVFSLFNSDPSVSIEGHICGLIAGLGTVVTTFLLWPKYIKPRWETLSGRLPFFNRNSAQILKESEEDVELAEQEPSQVVIVRPASVVMPVTPQPQQQMTVAFSQPTVPIAVSYDPSSLRMDQNYYDEVNAIVAREASKSSNLSAEDAIFGSAAAAPIVAAAPGHLPPSSTSQNNEFLNPFT